VFRPDVHFHCDVDFDPFLYMEDNKKVYGIYSHLASYLPLTNSSAPL